jgi:hypothetical protein
MLNAIFRPLEKWPGEPTPAARRQRAPFKAEYQGTLDLLQRELVALGAKGTVIQVQVPAARILNSGQLHPQAVLQGPAVMVSFRARDGLDYVYPCDTFNQWQDNLRAIALALEALRKVNRYGVTRRGEQYQGFRALPPPAEQRPKMLPDEAAAFLASKLDGVEARALATNQRIFEAMLKLLQGQLHPDAAGGSHEDFVRVQEAGAVLIEHFKQQAAKAGGAR